jgi:hypothetical protein
MPVWSGSAMLTQSNLIGETAMRIGLHIGTLDAKRIEKEAMRELDNQAGRSKGGKARAEQTARDREQILVRMKFRIEECGQTIPQAAKYTHEIDKLGKSEAANEKAWRRHSKSIQQRDRVI